jgi:hypothetical protein
MFTTQSSIRSAFWLGLLAVAALLFTSAAARAEDAKTETETTTKTKVEVEVDKGEIMPGDLKAPVQTTLAAPANCVYIEETEAQGAACRALIHNACARPVSVNVEHHIDYIKFAQRDISSRGVNADHHGEPAAGFFTSAGTFSGSMKAQIGPGKSRWFERFHRDASFHVDKCRVTFSSAW